MAPIYSSYPPSLNHYSNSIDGIQSPPTPPPTEEERAEEEKGLVDWRTMLTLKFWWRKKWIPWYIVGFLGILLTSLITIYHTQIITWLTPAAQWMRNLSFGWLIPVLILFVISFPPLFGHEIIAVLCGVVWGLWIGFAIVAAGTFIGEVGNFYAFKYCCHARSEKMEKNQQWYACMARVVREGGFKIALIARLSAIPVTTAVFATCGMSIWVFCIAAFLSLPKQFVTVYLGYILDQSGTGQETTGSRIASDSLVAVSLGITIFAAWWIYRKMMQVRPAVMREKRKLRAYKTISQSTENLTGGAFDDNASEIDVPLRPVPQKWDANKPQWQDPFAGDQERDAGRYSAYPTYQRAGEKGQPFQATHSLGNNGAAPTEHDLLAPSTSSPHMGSYTPPGRPPFAVSNESLQLPPMQPAPSSLDSSYTYVPGAPQPYVQRPAAARTPSPAARIPSPLAAGQPPQQVDPDLRNPFEEPSSELPYRIPSIRRVSEAPEEAQPAQSVPAQRPPFETFASAVAQDKPRGVQLTDG